MNPFIAPMSIQRKIILRYRTEGHVRFELPEELCSPERADYLSAGLRRIEGIFRVDLHRRQRKLSLRFIDTVLDLPTLVRGLAKVVNDAEKLADHSHRAAPFPKKKAQLVFDLFASVLILYLVKVHWKRITGQWLRDPIRYRYELLAVFYLIFLHLGPRRPKSPS